MKKLAIGILSAAFVLGAGTYAFAQGDGKSILNFEEVKPFMEKMHPNLSEKELRDMHQRCHENGGMMGNRNAPNMMNNF